MSAELWQVLQASIASGEALSSEVLCAGGILARIEMPAGWDAAPLSFQVDSDGTGYRSLLDADGNEVLVPSSGDAAAAKAYAVAAGVKLGGLMKLKLKSGTNASATNQTAARTITLIFGI